MYDTKRIDYLLAEKSMTQKELARRAKLAEGTVSRLMLTGSCRHETANKIAVALGVSRIELIKKEA